MVTRATRRTALKRGTRERILAVAARRLRREGAAGAAIGEVMASAGLTHGAFYAHFADKQAMLLSAFRHAMADSRSRWLLTPGADATWSARLVRLARRYLSSSHRDDNATDCPLAALAGDMPRASTEFRQAFEAELCQTISGIVESGATNAATKCRENEALALVALCVGGLSLSRAVTEGDLSARILKACRLMVGRVAACEGEQA